MIVDSSARPQQVVVDVVVFRLRIAAGQRRPRVRCSRRTTLPFTLTMPPGA
ncbi:hypothetical protein ACLK2H_05980 [Escherichia coli]